MGMAVQHVNSDEVVEDKAKHNDTANPRIIDVRYQISTVPVYCWKTVEIMITDVNYSGIGSSRMCAYYNSNNIIEDKR
jgi:hypothetical protein